MEDVDFPAGIYRIQLEGDDEAKLFIDGEKKYVKLQKMMVLLRILLRLNLLVKG